MSMNDKIPSIPNPLNQSSATTDAARQTVIPSDVNSDLERRITALENRRTNLNTDVFGMFETVSAVPSGAPKDVYDQIKIYSNSTTYRLYWYDYSNNAWRYASGT